MSETNTNTVVETISEDEMDNLLGTPGAASVMTADSDETEKPTFFQNGKVDTSFLNKPAPETPPASTTPPANAEEEAAAAAAAIVAAAAESSTAVPAAADDTTFDSLVDTLEGDDSSKGGRPKLDKGGMAQLVETLIKDKVILPFDEEGDKKLEDYTMDDYKELIQMNITEQKRQAEESTPKEFFEALPHELQYAAEYVANGGTDLKGLFKALAASEDNKAITTDTEQGQEAIVRNYLSASNFGDEAEIQEEIESWKDLDKLEAKAKQFKPKLDKMQEGVIQRQIQEQEVKKRQQQEASHQYANSVYETLAKGELNGLTLNQKTQNMLYQGLIQPNYPSVSGQNTNLFGHLIEKHQFVEPNHGLIAEALWLLADPDGYKAELGKGATNASVAATARQLKTEQANIASGGGTDEPGTGGNGSGKKQRTIKRPEGNFFKR